MSRIEEYKINIVVCQSSIFGYRRFNLMRASAVVNCQSTRTPDPLRARTQAPYPTS
ncbi:MAG: hypothetical protein KatS3mg023_1399 [Armatimonadota bacterium]|nr:MAG: hypothetical protein KatS3mg023_1399 [Armatimonadota bacterium]